MKGKTVLGTGTVQQSESNAGGCIKPKSALRKEKQKPKAEFR
jgi:hypothetical protein